MSHPTQPKIISKKHTARLKKEQQKQQILIVASVVILVVVIAVVLFGVLDQTILKMQKPVAKVDNISIKSSEFIKMVKLERQQLNAQALQYDSYKQFFGFDQSNLAYFDSLIQQIQTQMAVPETIGATVITNMINSKVIELYAKENGIVVSDDDVQNAIQKDFGFFPKGTPTPENTPTPFFTATLNPTQYAMVTATPEPVPTEAIVTEDSEPQVESTPIEEVQPTENVSEPSPTITPSPTAYTAELFQENYKSFIAKFAEIGFSEKDIKELYRNQMISQKVYEKITADVPTEEEQLWARHILVATEEEAQEVLNRLAKGEDWSVIAADVSTDTSNKDSGGDLGWFGHNKMVLEFEEAAYALQVGEISKPVKTSFGYHIIQLLGKEIRPFDINQLDQNKQKVFNDWLTTEKEKHKIEQFDDVWTKIVPNTPAFGDYQ